MFRMCAAVAVMLATPAIGQVCYRLPFSNPNLADGWGSTCCGRTNPHRGVDFPQAAGTSIPAVADGVVALKASNGCLGNVIIVRHADGMFSGYNHMNAQSPLAVGQAVTMGQVVGKVGATGTCANGAHLHLTMSATVGGYASGVTVDPYKWIAARTTCNTPPKGVLDAATCDGISGWAQDPNVATSAIPAHVYIGGPAGSAAARGFALTANINRSDLCTPLGSCSHGFFMPLPLSYFDGVERPVFAYAIDSAGGPNTAIGQKSFKCDAAALPKLSEGTVRRPIASMEIFTAWKMGLEDVAPMSDAALEAIPVGPALTKLPELVKPDGAPDLFVREYDVIRHVPNPDVMTAWKFSAFTTVPAASLDGVLRGADWSNRPFLAKGSGASIYLIDAPPPLWAELVSDDVPAKLAPGATASVTFTFKNRGSLKWDRDVELASTPRDLDSTVCDPSWPSCQRAAKLTAATPGEEGKATFLLEAPPSEGTITACFGLVRGTHWFSDVGQNGPADDAICKTIQIVVGAKVPPMNGGTGGGAGSNMTLTPVATGCTQAGGSVASLLGLAGLLLLRRRK